MCNKLRNQFEDLENGAHIALVYNQKKDWSKAISQFIAAAMENNEKIVYINDDYSVEFIKGILKDIDLDIERLINKGQLILYPREQIYENDFNPDNILDLLKKEAKKAIEEGYEAFNITGEISFLLKQHNSFKKIIEYEKKVEENLFKQFPVKALCRYNMEIFDEKLIKNMIQLHPYLVWENRLYKNPYYISIDSFNSKNIYKKELKEWLKNIKYYQKEKEKYFNNLKEEKNKFEILFNQVDDAIFVHGISKKGFTNFEMVNQEAINMLGYEREDLLSMGPKDIDSNKLDENFYEDKYNKLINNEHVKFEAEILTKNGEKIPIENKSHLFEYDGKEFVLTIARDISDRKKKEKIQEELLEEKTKFEFIVNEIKDALFVQGFTEKAFTNFKIVNQKACELLDYEKEELLDKSPDDIISKDSLKKLKTDNFRPQLLNGKKIKYNIDLIAKNGEKIPVENKSHVFEYKDEKLLLTVTRDMRKKLKRKNKLKKQYNEIKEKNLQLKTLNKRMNKLLSIMTELSRYSIKDEKKFLKKLFRTSFEIIPQAELGSVYFYKDNEVNFLDTIGHDKNKLNLARIDAEKFKKYNEVTMEKNIDGDLINRVSEEKYNRFIEGSEEVKETLTFDITSNNEYIGGISLDIKKFSSNHFGDISLNIFSSFKDIAEAFYKIQNYDKLRGEFTKELALSLINMMEFHDKYTIGHSENVALLVSKFAEYLNLDESEVSRIYWAGLVHDIGKIVIPSHILNKNGKLTEQEYETIKNHPYWAYETLKTSEQLSDIADYVLYHHERIDGNGYPEGIKGDNIPYGSKIIAICDCWDAMRSNRSYRNALTYDEAIYELKDNKDQQFSSVLVEKFINMLNNDNDKLFYHR